MAPGAPSELRVRDSRPPRADRERRSGRGARPGCRRPPAARPQRSRQAIGSSSSSPGAATGVAETADAAASVPDPSHFVGPDGVDGASHAAEFGELALTRPARASRTGAETTILPARACSSTRSPAIAPRDAGQGERRWRHPRAARESHRPWPAGTRWQRPAPRPALGIRPERPVAVRSSRRPPCRVARVSSSGHDAPPGRAVVFWRYRPHPSRMPPRGATPGHGSAPSSIKAHIVARRTRLVWDFAHLGRYWWGR